MFELRWIKRPEPAPEYGKSIAKNVKVLQFRTGEMVDAERGSQKLKWSKWQDVPTEESI